MHSDEDSGARFADTRTLLRETSLHGRRVTSGIVASTDIDHHQIMYDVEAGRYMFSVLLCLLSKIDFQT